MDRLRSVLRAAGLETAISAGRSVLNGVVASKRSLRGPYVQGVTPTTAVIAWRSKEPGTGVVKYGKAPELGWAEVDRRIGRRHAVAIAGLEPGSSYHYRVDSAGGPSATGTFRTAPVGEGSNFSFAVVGDSGSGGKGQLGVARLLERLGPDLVLHTGDVVYPDGEERHYDRRFLAPGRRAGWRRVRPIRSILRSSSAMARLWITLPRTIRGCRSTRESDSAKA